MHIFGAQFLSISIEVKKIRNDYFCMMDHGRENLNKTISQWLDELKRYNIGEIIVDSIDSNGIENEFEDDLLDTLKKKINCPKVLSGGFSNIENIYDLLKKRDIKGLSLIKGDVKKIDKENFKVPLLG